MLSDSNNNTAEDDLSLSVSEASPHNSALFIDNFEAADAGRDVYPVLGADGGF